MVDGAVEEFIILRNPTTLKVTHDRLVHTVSLVEMKTVMRGYFDKDFYMDVIKDEEGHTIHVMHPIDLSRFTWLPRYLYKKFVQMVCEATGIPFRAMMMESIVPIPLTPKARVVFTEKTVFEKAEKRLEEIKEVEKVLASDSDELIRFLKGVKELKKEGKI